MNMKFCKDCKWLLVEWKWIHESDLCECPKRLSLVTGEQLKRGATEARHDSDDCGVTAEWFEPK